MVGYYNAGDRMRFWGKEGAFWGGIWGLLLGSAFFWVPGIGPLLIGGPLVAWIVGALEGAAVVGGLSALGAGLYSLGIPKDSIVRYESAVKAGAFLVVAHGTIEEGNRARTVLDRAPGRESNGPHLSFGKSAGGSTSYTDATADQRRNRCGADGTREAIRECLMLEHEFDAQLLPWEVRRIAVTQRPQLATGDNQIAALDCDRLGVSPIDSVKAEQVSEVLYIDDIIDSDQLERWLINQQFQDGPSDSSKTVDGYFGAHHVLLPFAFSSMPCAIVSSAKAECA